MANSRRYHQLINRLNIIANSYIPATNPLGNYTSREKDDLRAYLLLVHAEFESYFEEVSADKVRQAHSRWLESRTKSNVLLALTSFCEYQNKEVELHERVKKSMSLYFNKLQKNNGVKEKNILDILLPVGIEHSQLDSTWLSTMNSFGAKRGEVAHSAAAVQNPLDPVSVRSDVVLILAEIQVLDEHIKALK